MAPRKMNPKLEKSRKERFQVKRVKTEMGKIMDDQNFIRAEQRKIRLRFGKIEKQCHLLKKETEIIMKQTARARIKVVLMFKILKARKGGDFIEAAKLTYFLRELVAKERADSILVKPE
ncbi:hypothetical protein PTKIN_Ptkin12aG0094300 [Pterospermum kingtungense]